ncbi:13078_t:CDS:2, partial [Entrophospora sp. SA101]
EPEIEESWPELGGTLLADKAKSKKFKSRYRDSGFDSIAVKAPSGDIIFEEAEVGDPDRQHSSLSSLSKWQAIVPSYENPAYAFNTPIDDPEKYAEAPYMPQLIASAREQITSVLKAELRRKDQIKSAIVVYCNYMKMEKKGEGKIAVPVYEQKYHNGKMRAILSENDIDEHITLSAGEIDAKIERFLNNGSGWTLIRIEMIYIEVYAFRRAVGGSFKPTPKNLANTKFNLDGIPMPTPICPRTFQKIEAQNPEISINVWEWKEETATPKPVIASKNFYIPNSCQVAGCEHPRPNECMTKRPHVIHLMALTDVNKSEDTDGDKVWDHNHITGKYRGSAHNDCNLQLRIQPWKTPIPIVFHNFRGYDSHLVCESVGRSVNAHQITVIAETFERYKMMKVGQMKYIDSMQFMNSSLAKLADNLGAVKCKDTDCNHYHRIDKDRCIGTLANHKITKQYYEKIGYSPEQIALVCSKGELPYDYIDSDDRFNETELPPIEAFGGKLNGKITQEAYEHAQKVWKEFGCRNLGEYHDLYLKTDVLLLTDIFTKFRETSMKHYGLDPAHYVSAPALSWDAMLKMTGVEIELFTEISMHDFVEKAKRGGIAMAVHRYFKANNPRMGDDYDPSQPTTWISYVDANNLYGWAMSQFLPIGKYKWLATRAVLNNRKDLQKRYLKMILNTKADSPRGYFLNIKAHFPSKLHDYLNDLPPAVENVAIKKNQLSPYNNKIVEDLDGGRFSEIKKLVTHLGPRENYVIHYQELQYYVKLGMVVDEVTEILSFDQTNWLAPYIKLNTELRQKAENDFEKDFFKLMNNSVYGKTMENYGRQLSNTLIGAHMGQASVVLNKPIIVGASVLGLSKLHMYQFWYGYVKEKYGDKAKLGYTDTDSFIFQTETEDIYKDMAERPDIFDLTDSKTIGLFKDECPGKIITESIHIRAKTYHYTISDGSTRSKHKGVSKSGMNKMATNTYFPSLGGSLLDDSIPPNKIFDPMTLVYRDCLFGNEVFYAMNIGFRSKDHILSMVESEKKALCPLNSKNWVLSDGITPWAYDHWRIDAYKSMVKAGMSPKLAEKRAIVAQHHPTLENKYMVNPKLL